MAAWIKFNGLFLFLFAHTHTHTYWVLRVHHTRSYVYIYTYIYTYTDATERVYSHFAFVSASERYNGARHGHHTDRYVCYIHYSTIKLRKRGPNAPTDTLLYGKARIIIKAATSIFHMSARLDRNNAQHINNNLAWAAAFHFCLSVGRSRTKFSQKTNVVRCGCADSYL